jgi:hypothetical protein
MCHHCSSLIIGSRGAVGGGREVVRETPRAQAQIFLRLYRPYPSTCAFDGKISLARVAPSTSCPRPSTLAKNTPRGVRYSFDEHELVTLAQINYKSQRRTSTINCFFNELVSPFEPEKKKENREKKTRS